jgi:dynein heavy chain
MWKAYVDYIDEIVIELLYEIIEFNLNYLLEESDPTLHKRPLFEVQLILDVIIVLFHQHISSID